MNPSNPVVLTGFAAFCAMVIQDPVVSFCFQLAILLTCAVIVGHIFISCWIANRKGARRHAKASQRVTNPQ